MNKMENQNSKVELNINSNNNHNNNVEEHENCSTKVEEDDPSVKSSELDYLQMSHSALVLKLFEAQREIQRLKSQIPENDSNGNANEIVVSVNSSRQGFSLSAGPISPICPTPPYEYININPRMLFYMNPKFCFRQADSTIASSHSQQTSPSGSVVLCFDPSEIDFELRQILHENPPITHKIMRKKSRLERGSSVPSIDSYYGTEDLNKVGHASYFIPMLSPEEKASIGWKAKYSYGKWKYLKPSMSNVPLIVPDANGNKSNRSYSSLRSNTKKYGAITNSCPNQNETPIFLESQPKVRKFFRWLLPNCLFHDDQKNSQTEIQGNPRPSFWNRIFQKQTNVAITGGDVLSSSRCSENTISKKPPPPVMIPVFCGDSRMMWFFGAKVPSDHQILLNNLRSNESKCMYVQ